MIDLYFSDRELGSKDNGVVKLDPRFADALLKLRETVKQPMHVNSCCRSLKHNKAIGGSSGSYHLYEGVDDGRDGTLAIDISVKNDAQRAIFTKTALAQGWSVGVYKTFIHLDMRTAIGKDQVVFWGKC